MLSALDCVFSHHAAIDLPTALRIERAGRVGQPATDLEAEFREIRKILHCRRELAFYSVQRLTLEREARKRVLAQVDAENVRAYRAGGATGSDSRSRTGYHHGGALTA